MSCHTWVYIKVKSLTEKQKSYIIDRELNEVTSWWGFRFSKSDLIKEFELLYKNLEKSNSFAKDLNISPKEEALNMLKRKNEQLEFLNNNKLKEYLEITEYPSCLKYNDELYCFLFCDHPFRSHIYSELQFTKKDDLLNWLKGSQQDKFGYYEDDKFIKGYTPELERRICDFFKEYGENNLLFQFG